MSRGRFFGWLLVSLMVVKSGQARLDDVDLNLRHPLAQFAHGDGVSFFNNAIADALFGRYLVGSENHDQAYHSVPILPGRPIVSCPWLIMRVSPHVDAT